MRIAPVRTPIRNVQQVRRQLADGRINLHYYHRPTGRSLPDPSSVEFTAAYAAAEKIFAESRKSDNTLLSVSSPALAPGPRNTTHTFPSKELSATGPEEIYYTPEEVARRWRARIDVETLANWRSKRQGPPFAKFGRVVLYPADRLQEWERRRLISCD